MNIAVVRLAIVHNGRKRQDRLHLRPILTRGGVLVRDDMSPQVVLRKDVQHTLFSAAYNASRIDGEQHRTARSYIEIIVIQKFHIAWCEKVFDSKALPFDS